MLRRALLVPASALVLASCGTDGEPSQKAPLSTVRSDDFVASETIGVRQTMRLFALPGLGQFSAHCVKRRRAEIRYRAAVKGATQLVTTEGRATGSNSKLRPGQSMAVSLGRQVGWRGEWQLAEVSAGEVRVATASFTVDTLAGARGCFVSGKAEVATRPR